MSLQICIHTQRQDIFRNKICKVKSHLISSHVKWWLETRCSIWSCQLLNHSQRQDIFRNEIWKERTHLVSSNVKWWPKTRCLMLSLAIQNVDWRPGILNQETSYLVSSCIKNWLKTRSLVIILYWRRSLVSRAPQDKILCIVIFTWMLIVTVPVLYSCRL